MLQYHPDKLKSEKKDAGTVIFRKVTDMKLKYDAVPHEEGDEDENVDDQGVDVENNVEEDDMEPGVAAADDAARAKEYKEEFKTYQYSNSRSQYPADFYCDLTQSDEENQAPDKKDMNHDKNEGFQEANFNSTAQNADDAPRDKEYDEFSSNNSRFTEQPSTQEAKSKSNAQDTEPDSTQEKEWSDNDDIRGFSKPSNTGHKLHSNSQAGKKFSKRGEDDGVQSESESTDSGDSIQFKDNHPKYTYRYVDGEKIKKKSGLPYKFKEFR